MGINYYSYIKSDKWRQRADAAKRRAAFRCQVCNRSSSQVTLDAHHRTYDRLGNELPEDITVLCRDCHSLYEQHKKLPRSPQYIPPAVKNPYQPLTVLPTATASNHAVKQDGARKTLDRDKPWRIVIVIGMFAWVALMWWVITWSPTTKTDPATTKNTAAISQVTKIYGGPGKGHAVLGILAKGTVVTISGYKVCGSDTWYQIGKDKWIAGQSVNGKPINLPIVNRVCLSLLVKEENNPTPEHVSTTLTEAPTEFYGTVKRGANIRQGPGTGYPVIRTVVKGARITITGYTNCNSDTWYQVGTSQWIAAFLVDVVRVDVPYVEIECKVAAPSTPTRLPPTATPKSVASTANCAGGCIVYPDWCAPPIKGNVSYNTGEKIYHVPGQEYYTDTVINPSDGERWFCTEQEALAAGWRRSKR